MSLILLANLPTGRGHGWARRVTPFDPDLRCQIKAVELIRGGVIVGRDFAFRLRSSGRFGRLAWAFWVEKIPLAAGAERVYVSLSMLTNTQDPAGRYTFFLEEVRRIGEERCPRYGVARQVHLMLWELFTHILTVLAGLAEKRLAGGVSDVVPEDVGAAVGSVASSAVGGIAAVERLGEQAGERGCAVAQRAGVAGGRAADDAGADCGGDVGGAQGAAVEPDTAAGLCADGEAFSPLAPMARIAGSFGYGRGAFEALAEAVGLRNGAILENGGVGVGFRAFVLFRFRNVIAIPPRLTANGYRWPPLPRPLPQGAGGRKS